MTRSASLRRLHFLNSLFAPLTGQDLYLARQIDDAITTSLPEVKVRGPADPDFASAAARLFERLCADRERHGFYHWDAAGDTTAASPLFARAGVLDGLKRLAPYAESTVLVTNLRHAHCPPKGRWTARRRREYDDTLALLQDLAARRTRRSANVNVFFL